MFTSDEKGVFLYKPATSDELTLISAEEMVSYYCPHDLTNHTHPTSRQRWRRT